MVHNKQRNQLKYNEFIDWSKNRHVVNSREKPVR